ncbi:MAG: lysophospholipase [Deltaproteobacteria bacterium]|nr:lysophospholipase [Candidatus Zymogenaceae bacterium]
MSTYVHDEAGFEGAGGVHLFYRFYKPKEYKNVIIYVHGLGDHSGRYVYPIEYLIDHGIAFYGLDHRGHGKSDGKRGHVDRFSQYIDDLRTFVSIVRKREGTGKALFLFGHSMGGLIAARFVEEYPQMVRGLILSSAALEPNREPPPMTARMGAFLSKHIPKFTMTNEIDPVFLSHDKTVIKRYTEDRLVHNKISARLLTEMAHDMKTVFEKASEVRIPVLVMHAGDDHLISLNGSRRFFQELGSEDKKLAVFEGFYHDLVNEVDRIRVFQEMETWLEPMLLA